jgi:hypothetical protein
MSGVIPPLLNTPSWRGVQLKQRDNSLWTCKVKNMRSNKQTLRIDSAAGTWTTLPKIFVLFLFLLPKTVHETSPQWEPQNSVNSQFNPLLRKQKPSNVVSFQTFHTWLTRSEEWVTYLSNPKLQALPEHVQRYLGRGFPPSTQHWTARGKWNKITHIPWRQTALWGGGGKQSI